MKYFIYRRKSQEAEDRQVMSLESQSDEIKKIIDANPEIEIIDDYEEAYSAKSPGRPIFNEMIKRIEKGHAQGIIAWHPDRLARNSIDGGQIIYQLDQLKLKDLKFCTYNFENSPEGKFMLNIIFSYSKLYVDALSKNVKRGMNTKVKQGWRPNLAPTGYKNCKETSTIIPDPVHFKVIRKMFDLYLFEHHSPSEIHRIACKDWAYTMPRRKKQGGKPPALSSIYKILANPFYAGYIKWKGQLHEGKHKPVISKQEFTKAQKLLGNSTPARSKSKTFAYTGLFTCGACGLSVTAELKTKPSGKQYTYYHCTRVHSTPKCKQPSINLNSLDDQIETFLNKACIPQSLFEWLIKTITANEQLQDDLKHQQHETHEKKVSSLEKQLRNLIDMRIRELLTEEDFEKKQLELQANLAAARETLATSSSDQFMFEPVKILGLFNAKAKKWFFEADDEGKRKILKILCSNPNLIDKKAILTIKKPFRVYKELARIPQLCTTVEDVRTHYNKTDKLISEYMNEFVELSKDESVRELSNQALTFIRNIEPELLSELSRNNM